jgi:hypothetical protein
MPLLTVRQLQLNEVFQDMARVAFEHRPHSKAGKVIVLKARGMTARALARGAPGREPDSIYLDDATRDRLGLSVGEQVDFTISPGRFWDEFRWGFSATNAVHRVATRLGLISVGLGLLGLLLGLVALWLTLSGR